MAMRYWVKTSDGELAVDTYFDTKGRASAVAEALGVEAGGEYIVANAP